MTCEKLSLAILGLGHKAYKCQGGWRWQQRKCVHDEDRSSQEHKQLLPALADGKDALSYVPDLYDPLCIRRLSCRHTSMSLKRILVTGGCGQIAYALLGPLLSGKIFGPNTLIILHLLDIAGMESSLNGLQMEINDSASSVVMGVIATTDLTTAFDKVDYCVLLGGFPRQPGMERKELLSKNVQIISSHAEALDKYASKNVKVLVVANPANTLCLVAQQTAKSIPPSNFTCLTRLDHDRMRGLIAHHISSPDHAVKSTQVRNVIIWGNHSSTLVPSAAHCEVDMHGNGGWMPLRRVIPESDEHWLYETLVMQVQQRGAEVLKARKHSSALSAAQAIANHLTDWVHGTSQGSWVSMGVLSTGNSYGIPDDLYFSFPCQCHNGEWRLVEGLEISKETRARMFMTIRELEEEKSHALGRSSNL